MFRNGLSLLLCAERQLGRVCTYIHGLFVLILKKEQVGAKCSACDLLTQDTRNCFHYQTLDVFIIFQQTRLKLLNTSKSLRNVIVLIFYIVIFHSFLSSYWTKRLSLTLLFPMQTFSLKRSTESHLQNSLRNKKVIQFPPVLKSGRRVWYRTC